MPLVLPNIRKVLKPNGYLLFCDYATGDLAQIAFAWAIVDIYFCVRRAFVMYMEDIYFCTILCFKNTVFLYVIFNLDGLYLVVIDLYDTWNKMLQKVFG
ncbi:hypothetical protein ACSBR2_000281 [Camellia fascicularis]